MYWSDSWLKVLVSFLDAVTLSPFSYEPSPQRPLQAQDQGLEVIQRPGEPPSFTPPYPPGDAPPPDVAIKCTYPEMTTKGWTFDNDEKNREGWLKKPGDQPYDINTDYEKRWPTGIKRKYILDVAEMTLAPDGVAMPAKVFNGSYPGPWIQACWGDEIEVTIRNNLWYNGTTIHWHGVRQWNNVAMDGVNGVTQCPIAPGENFTYTFNATQYGSSWYHSHYSLQYADGLAGPLTIYGPSSDNYDYAIEPILMTDWNHRSAFEDWAYSINTNGAPPSMTNILLNGRGRYNLSKEGHPNLPIGQPERYSEVFEKGKRYLLRLINTSLDTTFVFSIDGHNVTVVGADFVPIVPYSTNSVLVGIGQRYHVIVEAKPIKTSAGDNYWIRTIPAVGCSTFRSAPDTKTGIIRYDAKNTDDPTSTQNTFSIACSDEPYQSLVPKVKWTVGPPANKDKPFFVHLKKNTGSPYHPSKETTRWTAYKDPLWLDFSKPTISNYKTANGNFPDYLDVVTQNQKDDSWIYLVLTLTDQNDRQAFAPGAHPIHLHGHDFALLAQENSSYPGSLDQIKDKLKLINPPRRDVVLLPKGGYIVIAFKADNPGPWALHCHIAWHASSGLVFQVLENVDKMLIPAAQEKALKQTCDKWNAWVGDVKNHWNITAAIEFQDDSGA